LTKPFFVLADTAVLVECEVHQNNAIQTNHEEISLDVQPCSLEGSEMTEQQSEANGQLASPEDISIEDLPIPAHRLDDKYRYHAFVSYNPNDRHWVEEDLIHRLEAEPHSFKCCFDQRDYDKNVSEIQNIVCSIMLSERVIIVLSPSYVENSWLHYEETIAHITAISQHKQRVIILVLDDCEIPDALKMLNYISVHSKNYWNRLLLLLQHGKFSSVHSKNYWNRLLLLLQHGKFSSVHSKNYWNRLLLVLQHGKFSSVHSKNYWNRLLLVLQHGKFSRQSVI
jgi:toll-like receptor 13